MAIRKGVPRYSGFGPGKRGGWTRRVYKADGTVVDDGPQRARTSSTRSGKGSRFQPFVSHQVDRKTARQLGLERLPRAKGGGTAFKSERELNRYLAHEKAAGRSVGWKEHAHGE